MSINNYSYEITMTQKSTPSFTARKSATPNPPKKRPGVAQSAALYSGTRTALLKKKVPVETGKRGFYELMQADEPRRVVAVHDGLTTAIMEQAAQALSISKTEFLAALRLPVSTMTRRLKTGARLSPDESDKVDRVAQTFKRAIELFGNEETAREWMSTKLLGLGDRTPLELLDSSAGYEMVLNTIGRIAYGAAA